MVPLPSTQLAAIVVRHHHGIVGDSPTTRPMNRAARVLPARYRRSSVPRCRLPPAPRTGAAAPAAAGRARCATSYLRWRHSRGSLGCCLLGHILYASSRSSAKRCCYLRRGHAARVRSPRSPPAVAAFRATVTGFIASRGGFEMRRASGPTAAHDAGAGNVTALDAQAMLDPPSPTTPPTPRPRPRPRRRAFIIDAGPGRHALSCAGSRAAGTLLENQRRRRENSCIRPPPLPVWSRASTRPSSTSPSARRALPSDLRSTAASTPGSVRAASWSAGRSGRLTRTPHRPRCGL